MEPPDLSLVRSYLNLIPKPDLVIVPSVPLDVSLSRVVRRGVWKFFRDKSEDALKLYLTNSNMIVCEAVSYMKSLGWNLIEVDNELHFTHSFMTPAEKDAPKAEQVCALLATIMAHGCNIGPYTMSHLIDGISYHRIKHITDWILTEDAQRRALAQVVNAISRLDITRA